jgi:hypothetical protein
MSSRVRPLFPQPTTPCRLVGLSLVFSKRCLSESKNLQACALRRNRKWLQAVIFVYYNTVLEQILSSLVSRLISGPLYERNPVRNSIYAFLSSYLYFSPLLLYSDSLRAGRSGDRIPVVARFSTPAQTDLRPTQPPVRRVTGLLLWGKAVGALSSAEVKERVALYSYSPSGML